MDKNKMKTFQLSMLLLTVVPAAKFFVMPVYAAQTAGIDAYIMIAILSVLELILVFWLSLSLKRVQNTCLYEVLSSCIGKVFARILLCVYAAFFLLKSLLPILELRQLFVSSVYDTAPKIGSMLPFIIAAAYLSSKGLKAVGRTSTLLGFVTPACVAILFILSLSSMNLDNLLPVLNRNPSFILPSLKSLSIWFGDSLILLIVFGKLVFRNTGMKSPVILYAISAIITIAFAVIFTAIYGATASMQGTAINQISKFNTALTNLGRFDWIPILLLTLPLISASAVWLHGSISFLTEAFHIEKHGDLLSAGICALAILLLFALQNLTDRIVFFTEYLSYPAIVLQYVLPLFLPLVTLIYTNKQRKIGTAVIMPQIHTEKTKKRARKSIAKERL